MIFRKLLIKLKKIFYCILYQIKHPLSKLKTKYYKYIWRKRNKHNDTVLNRRFDMSLVQIGKNTYGPIDVSAYTRAAKLYIGNYCSIAPEVKFILSADHPVNFISTFPFRVKILGESAEAMTKGDIVVDDDVWIGQRATILSGVHIGQGAIVAAGAIVTRDIPPYSVWGGVPARFIKYRFSPKIIDDLLKIDYSKLNKELIETNIEKLYESVTENTDLSWLPKKG